MGHIVVARGGQLDILFSLLTQKGGSYTDDQDWVNGATTPEWPGVTIKTQGGSPTDVTSQFAKNISGDVFESGVIKHPTTTTGIWRRAALGLGLVGRYAIRVIPQNALALGDYDITVTYDVNGLPFSETHTLSLVASGDVDFGEGSPYCTLEEVLSNFELETLVTTGQVDKARSNSTRMVHAYLEAEEITVPYTGTKGSNALKSAAIAFARAELRRLIAGTSFPGTGVRRVKESDAEFEFVSGDSQFKALHQEGAVWMELAIKAILGSIMFKVGTMNTPSYADK